MFKNFVTMLSTLLILSPLLASALANAAPQVRDLEIGKSGYVGTWFLWADNPKELCLDAAGEVVSERTSWAMMQVQRRTDGYWVQLPENYMLEVGDDTFQSKSRGECLKVEGFLD